MNNKTVADAILLDKSGDSVLHIRFVNAVNPRPMPLKMFKVLLAIRISSQWLIVIECLCCQPKYSRKSSRPSVVDLTRDRA
jgi:hypothetical protein